LKKYPKQNVFCRNLQDITLIGISPWIAKETVDLSLKIIIRELDGQNDLEYIKSTPTLLIADDIRSLLNKTDKTNNKDFFEEINISFELIGNRKGTYHHSADKIINHLSLGIESETPLEEYPMKASFIYLKPYSENKSKLKVHNWEYFQPLTIWERRIRYHTGQFDSLLPEINTTIEIAPVPVSQIKEVLAHVSRDHIMFINGFPGSGKGEIYDYLMSSENCLSIKIENYDISDFKKRLDELLAENKKDNETIILFQDICFPYCDTKDRIRYIKELKNSWRSMGQHSKGLIYFYSTNPNDNEFFNDIGLDHQKSIKVNALNETIFNTLFSQYASYAPIHELDIKKLSGKHAGFLRLILDEVMNNYNKAKSKGEVLNRDFCTGLLVKL